MDVVDASLLLDFYGQLLTERMRLILELYFNEDMSLAEIAEQEDVSRQAVHDTVRRGMNQLRAYEDKLRLLERFASQQEIARKALAAIKQGQAARAEELLSNLIDTL